MFFTMLKGMCVFENLLIYNLTFFKGIFETVYLITNVKEYLFPFTCKQLRAAFDCYIFPYNRQVNQIRQISTRFTKSVCIFC